jgi:hypothetical protein
MDKNEFTALYDQWFALHPFKKRDWVELGKVHYQAFGKESVALMTEALGQLTEELDHFPLPKDIRSKLNKLSSSKTEGGQTKSNVTSESEQIATRLLEHRHGVHYNGKVVKRPENVPAWIEQLVERVDNELGVQYPLTAKLGTLGFMVVQTEGRR